MSSKKRMLVRVRGTLGLARTVREQTGETGIRRLPWSWAIARRLATGLCSQVHFDSWTALLFVCRGSRQFFEHP